MSFESKNTSSSKISLHELKDNPLAASILEQSANNELSCARTFKIARATGVSPQEIGRTLDLCRVRLVKCQLGLFGYSPDKKIIQPKEPEDEGVRTAIMDGLRDERLPCKTAWDIALRCKVPKMTISSACEALGVKIKPCQLGAF